MGENKMIQALATGMLTSIVYYLNAVAAPVVLLVLVMAIDYITGMISAWKSRELSSREGLFGIVKKLCYLFAVGAAVVVDWLINVGFGMVGITFGVNMLFCVLVTIWLIINELISILENLNEIGVPIPKFLTSIVKRLKTAADSAGEETEENKNDKQ